MEREVPPQGQIIPNCSPKRVRPGHLETRTPAGLVGHGVCVGGVSNANTGNRDPIPVTKPNDVQDQKEPPAQEIPWPDRRGQGADLPPQTLVHRWAADYCCGRWLVGEGSDICCEVNFKTFKTHKRNVVNDFVSLTIISLSHQYFYSSRSLLI